MSTPIKRCDLKHDETARRLLIDQLIHRGFGLISISDPELLRAVNAGLDRAEALEGFRFPPINVETIRYHEVERDAFRALYTIALDCLNALKPDLARDVYTSQERGALTARYPELFSASPHEPFSREHPFHSTFFNLFNYDHGSLNGHQDRGLLTVICMRPASPQLGGEASALWVEGADQTWRSADREILDALSGARSEPAPLYALVLIGEAGEDRLRDISPELFAAEHSVRVTPEGPYLERSHYVRDPSSRERANRLSAAMILNRV